MKYILVSGGVISGIGKGIFASSLGVLLKTLGLRVTAIKIDPYMNIDAGTMSPIEHGEVFVLNDGGEVDLDLGNYERFLDVTLTKDNNITTGKIYQQVIQKERKGEYLGKTVQVVPHITDAIQEWIERVAMISVDHSGEKPDVCIIELGGTVGDIESAPFIEAMRQFQFRVGHENFALAHVSLVPIIGPVGEQKTKPTQTTIRELRALGLSPDLVGNGRNDSRMFSRIKYQLKRHINLQIACRCCKPLEPEVRGKISMFCHVGKEQVISVRDVLSTYHVPLLLKEQGVLSFFRKRLDLNIMHISTEQRIKGECILKEWTKLTEDHDRLNKSVTIVLVGKYTNLQDSYLSVIKALEHSGLKCERKLILKWVEASELEHKYEKINPEKYREAWNLLSSANGILVPGGFGNRGTEGKITAAKWAREKKIPYLGICLGLQIAVIEFARNACGFSDANSEEFEPDVTHKIVINMPEVSLIHLGGTMRLGMRSTIFQDGTEKWSITRKLYEASNFIAVGKKHIDERHRHRYEVNPEYISALEEKGMHFVGRDETGKRMEIMELKGHPFFVGTQYHPEYLSRPLKPSPPLLGFVMASAGLSLDNIFQN
ncbi:30653_t:CDS:10 [Racocetra persica]|uniref:30653_t:CDS:1 n=1 Tax=Racocetra persica TaxID=160502 RepID=A0ACA9LGH4_9GLOM|nr:30653_t:CDS:10 [Racocetra persica]